MRNALCVNRDMGWQMADGRGFGSARVSVNRYRVLVCQVQSLGVSGIESTGYRPSVGGWGGYRISAKSLRTGSL